jgi:cell division protein FtsL
MNPFAFLGHRVRGFRVIDLGAVAVLTVLIIVVYLTKAGAGATRADIDRVQQDIAEQQTAIRLLRAEVASEEQPERLSALSARYLRLQPIAVDHDIPSETLADVAHVEPAAMVAPPAVPSPEAAPAAQAAASPVRGGR